MLQFLHDLDLHENEVFLRLLGQVWGTATGLTAHSVQVRLLAVGVPVW
jgi:hypothetical protein